jgi:hypothetical protein
MLKNLLTSFFLALTVSVFMLISTDAAAKPKNQSCPAGEVLEGYDIYGNPICVIDGTLDPNNFACPCFDKATVQTIIQSYRGWRVDQEGQCFRDEGVVKYLGCEPLGPNNNDCNVGIVAAGVNSLIGSFGPSPDSVHGCITIDEQHKLPLFGSEFFTNKYGQALMPHTAQACMDIILEVMEEEGCPREDDCGNGIRDPNEECDYKYFPDESDCTQECIWEPF